MGAGWELDDDARGDGGVREEIVSLEEGLAEVQTWVKEEGLLGAK